jgi:hypothetical protein
MKSPATLPFPFNRLLAAAKRPGVDPLIRRWIVALLTRGKYATAEAGPEPAGPKAA